MFWSLTLCRNNIYFYYKKTSSKFTINFIILAYNEIPSQDLLKHKQIKYCIHLVCMKPNVLTLHTRLEQIWNHLALTDRNCIALCLCVLITFHSISIVILTGKKLNVVFVGRATWSQSYTSRHSRRVRLAWLNLHCEIYAQSPMRVQIRSTYYATHPSDAFAMFPVVLQSLTPFAANASRVACSRFSHKSQTVRSENMPTPPKWLIISIFWFISIVFFRLKSTAK